MDNDLKKYIEERTEKLAAMVAEGFASTATKQEVTALGQEVTALGQEVTALGQEVSDLRTEVHERFDKVEASLAKRYEEIDALRDRQRVLETRVDHLEAVHR
jgi:ubiquinone biosynthesis protein UbiJ